MGSRTTPTSARTLKILEVLASDPLREYSQAEIQRRLGISHGHLHTILATMEATGHVRRDPTTRSYTIGPALLVIGEAARRSYPVVEMARPYMESLAAEFDTECQAATRVGNTLLVVARVGPLQPLGYGVSTGERIVMTPPIGTSFVSWSSESEIEAYLHSGADDLSTAEMDHYRKAMAQVRQRGYSVHVEADPRQRRSEEAERVVHQGSPVHDTHELASLAQELAHSGYLLGDPEDATAGTVISVGGPVFGIDGEIVLGVAISFVPLSMTQRPVREVAERLLETTTAITRSIGGRSPLHVRRRGNQGATP